MQTRSVTEFKAQALGILEQVVQTGEPVIVTKQGKAIVKVIEVRPKRRYCQMLWMGLSASVMIMPLS